MTSSVEKKKIKAINNIIIGRVRFCAVPKLEIAWWEVSGNVLSKSESAPYLELVNSGMIRLGTKIAVDNAIARIPVCLSSRAEKMLENTGDKT